MNTVVVVVASSISGGHNEDFASDHNMDDLHFYFIYSQGFFIYVCISLLCTRSLVLGDTANVVERISFLRQRLFIYRMMYFSRSDKKTREAYRLAR